MVRGLGIDLCAIGRIEKAIQKPRFLERVYTPAERSRILAASEARRGEIAAGLFAAKEAVSKALGTGFVGFGPGDIEIIPDGAGKPQCVLHGKALERAGNARPWVSVTHEDGVAAAVAVLEE